MRKRWIMVDGKLLPEAVARDRQALQVRNPNQLQIIDDIQDPFVSVVDGTTISSRSDLREHNIRNQCHDVGNDPAYRNPRNPVSRPQPVAQLIAEVIKGGTQRG